MRHLRPRDIAAKQLIDRVSAYLLMLDCIPDGSCRDAVQDYLLQIGLLKNRMNVSADDQTKIHEAYMAAKNLMEQNKSSPINNSDDFRSILAAGLRAGRNLSAQSELIAQLHFKIADDMRPNNDIYHSWLKQLHDINNDALKLIEMSATNHTINPP